MDTVVHYRVYEWNTVHRQWRLVSANTTAVPWFGAHACEDLFKAAGYPFATKAPPYALAQKWIWLSGGWELIQTETNYSQGTCFH